MRFMTQMQINGLMGKVNIVKYCENPKVKTSMDFVLSSILVPGGHAPFVSTKVSAILGADWPC